MKHTQLFEEFVNEVSGAKPAILVKLYNELSKAKNKVSLSWEFDGMEEFPHVVKFTNGLESEAHRHEGDMEEFSFYLNDDAKTILGIYDLNGYDQELKTPKDAIEWCRANESVDEKIVNENFANDKRQIKQTVKAYNAKKVGENTYKFESPTIAQKAMSEVQQYLKYATIRIDWANGTLTFEFNG